MKRLLQSLAVIAFLMMTLQFQLIKTSMNVTIRDELGNTVEAATVTLYETEENYKAEKDPVATQTTDAKGLARFKDLKPMSYFVLAKKDDKNNFGGGEQTGKLEEKRINKVTIVIE
jgi:hypothetical protein